MFMLKSAERHVQVVWNGKVDVGDRIAGSRTRANDNVGCDR